MCDAKNCSVCVHGHNLDYRDDSEVVCGPQHKVHAATYCCSGFRRITTVEVDERKAAKFGIFTGQQEAETRICPKCGRDDAMIEHSPGEWVCHHTHRI